MEEVDADMEAFADGLIFCLVTENGLNLVARIMSLLPFFDQILEGC